MTTDPRVLDAIVKAYDVRGTTPDQMNEDVARALGTAFAVFTGAPSIVVARDMRLTGESLVAAFADGAVSQGASIIDLGLASTDMVYFAAGTLDMPGAMFTASHNPAQYNGIKFCLSGARPVGIDTGLGEIRDTAKRVLAGSGQRRRPPPRHRAPLPPRHAAPSRAGTCSSSSPTTWCPSSTPAGLRR